LHALPAHGQSLIDLYESARGYDATYQAARAQYDASLARAAQAKAGILPSVGLSAGASHTELEVNTPVGGGTRGFNTQTAGINATQPLYRPANFPNRKSREMRVAIAIISGPVNSARKILWSYLRCM